jgi:hypothetical protein
VGVEQQMVAVVERSEELELKMMEEVVQQKRI